MHARFRPFGAAHRHLHARRGAAAHRRALSETSPDGTGALERLARDVRACRVCADVLPLGPRPVIHVSATARLLIASQAPGTAVHEKGLSFWDASGDRLRDWLEVDRDTFYDSRRIAIVPMGFCYPGRLPAGGDRPPRPECAPRWRDRLIGLMPSIRLTLLVGTYAQNAALGDGRSMTERVRRFRDYLPAHFPLPHPSWRTVGWAMRNPWFEAEVLPALRTEVARVFDDDEQAGRLGIRAAPPPGGRS